MLLMTVLRTVLTTSRKAVAIPVVGLLLVLTACASSFGALPLSKNAGSPVDSCSLLTGTEAEAILGLSQVIVPVPDKPERAIAPNVWSACTYAGPPGPMAPEIYLLVRRTEDLPRCLIREVCPSPGTQDFIVDGVVAHWVPFNSQALPTHTTFPGKLQVGSLSFVREPNYVTIDISQTTDALDAAKRTMALILGRL